MGTNAGAAGIRPYIWMLCGCFWFTLMAVFAHEVSKYSDCWQLVAIARSGLATLFALTTALATGAKLVFLRPRVLWVRSVAGSCSMLTTFYALTQPDFPISNVLTLTNTFPMWVALLSWPLSGERPSLGVWGAAGCAVLGVALTQQPHLIDSSLPAPVKSDREILGMHPAAWSALAASFFTATAMLGLNRLRGVSSLGVVVHFSAVSTMFGLLVLALGDRGSGITPALNPSVLALLVGVGAAATAGQIFLTLAFSRGTATKVSVVGLSQVVMVMTVEAAGGMSVGWVKLVGTLLVLGPTAWLMVRERRTSS